MSLRSGIQLDTRARSSAHFFSAWNLMNFQAWSGYLHDEEIEAGDSRASVAPLPGTGPTDILPAIAGLSTATLAIAQ